ncbi:hypothetical protein BDV12DRAFT_204202 [Aspergillus spectabilis]
MQSCAEKNGWTKFVAVQPISSSYFDLEEERELNKFRNETGVAIVTQLPFPAGHDASLNARLLSFNGITEVSNYVEGLARRKGWTAIQVASAWTLQRVTNTIFVCYSAKSIDDALSVRGKKLSEEEINYLEEPYTPSEIEEHH